MDEITKAEFRTLEKAVGDIKDTLNQVHGAIIGNPLSEDGGMSKRLTDAEEKIDELEAELNTVKTKQIKYNIYTIIMWTSLGAVVAMIFALVIQSIFKK